MDSSSLRYAYLTTILRAVAAPLTMLLMLRCFNPDQQGLYYTFASLMGLQALLDLGLGSSLVVFVSHERAGPASGHRLGGLVRAALIYYAGVSALLALLLCGPGTLWLAARVPLADFLGPWLLLAIMCAGRLAVTPAWSALEGDGAVRAVYRYRFLELSLGLLATWASLFLGAGLWTQGLTQALILGLALIVLAGSFGPLARQALAAPTGSFNWRQEVWPIQWRQAIVYGCGVPIALLPSLVYYFRGPAEAGQFGITNSLATVAAAVAIAPSQVALQRVATVIAAGNAGEVLSLVRSILTLSSSLLVLCGSAVVGLLWGIQLLHWNVAARFLPLEQAAALTLTSCACQLTVVLANFVRAHRVEPFVTLGLASGAATLVTSGLLIPRWGSGGAVAAFATGIMLVTLPGTCRIASRYLRRWQDDLQKTSAVSAEEGQAQEEPEVQVGQEA